MMKCTSEYMQLVNKNGHAGVTIYGWKHFCMIEADDIDEYGAPSRVGPKANCPSFPPLGGPDSEELAIAK